MSSGQNRLIVLRPVRRRYRIPPVHGPFVHGSRKAAFTPPTPRPAAYLECHKAAGAALDGAGSAVVFHHTASRAEADFILQRIALAAASVIPHWSRNAESPF